MSPSAATKATPLLVLGFAVLLGGGLVGCAGEPTPTPSVSPTASVAAKAAPIFASDDEALAAAGESYSGYLRLDSQIAADGGTRPERIRTAVTSEYGDDLVAEYESMQRAGIHIVGSNVYRNLTLVQWDHVQLLQAYACVGVGDTRIIGPDGTDLTPERDQELSVLLSFEWDGSDSFRLARSDLWSGTSIC